MPIAGGVSVTGFVSPTDVTDTYATHKAEYGAGGHRTVTSITDRDNIPVARREEGMTVWVVDTATEYRLVGGILNTDWVIISGSAVSTVNTRYTAGEAIQAFKVCVVVGGSLYYADYLTPSHASLTKYFSLTGGSIGTLIEVVEEGRVEDPSISLIPDTSYFLGTAGGVTTTLATTGFVQKVFVAETVTSLYFDPKPSIKL